VCVCVCASQDCCATATQDCWISVCVCESRLEMCESKTVTCNTCCLLHLATLVVCSTLQHLLSAPPVYTPALTRKTCYLMHPSRLHSLPLCSSRCKHVVSRSRCIVSIFETWDRLGPLFSPFAPTRTYTCTHMCMHTHTHSHAHTRTHTHKLTHR